MLTLKDVLHDGVRFIAAGTKALPGGTTGNERTPLLLGSYDGKHWTAEETPLPEANSDVIDGYLNLFAIDLEDGIGGGPATKSVYVGSESGRLDLVEDAVVTYTKNIYYHTAVGETEHYTRLYVTTTTPDNLFYYCDTHGLSMGGNLYLQQVNTSNVYMKTLDENGFSQGTDFYIVNTISPKVVEVFDGSATAPDGRPFIDIEETLNVDFQDNSALTEVRDYEPSYVLKFDESHMTVNSDTITFDQDHKLKDGYALFYYTAPGDKPVGGLVSGQVYYANVTGTRSINHRLFSSFTML